MQPFDALVIGAGPIGLACAIELTSQGRRVITIEKDCLTASVYRFPEQMRFFSGPQALEIGGVPMESAGDRPTRAEALAYYRGVAAHYRLQVRQREAVHTIKGVAGSFEVETTRSSHCARAVVIATGYFDKPNLLGIPGETLDKVTHYYRDAHPYAGFRVAVIGGRNSAGIAAIELARAGAHVTVIHRGKSFGVKPWIARDLHCLIEEERIQVLYGSRVLGITENSVEVQTGQERHGVPNDFVFAMTGYHSDLDFLCRNGIPLTPCGTRPVFNAKTLESGRPGVYLAGTVITGTHTHEMSIETGRCHGLTLGASLRQVFNRAGSGCRTIRLDHGVLA